MLVHPNAEGIDTVVQTLLEKVDPRGRSLDVRLSASARTPFTGPGSTFLALSPATSPAREDRDEGKAAHCDQGHEDDRGPRDIFHARDTSTPVRDEEARDKARALIES